MKIKKGKNSKNSQYSKYGQSSKNAKKLLKLFLYILLLVVGVNILMPLFCRKPDEKYVENLEKTEFTSDTPGSERICCIDDNEEALLWRLRLIGSAKKRIVFATFDLRADESGTDLIAALNQAAQRGVQIQILIDGIYQKLFLEGSLEFQALEAYENVEVGIYNDPLNPGNLFKVNYRMHDKYVIIDDEMYLLGGRNSNDIFLGDKTTDINVDRDILVYDTSKGQGESLLELEAYFEKIWTESCVKIKGGQKNEEKYREGNNQKGNNQKENNQEENLKEIEKQDREQYTQQHTEQYIEQYQLLRERYAKLKQKYQDIETYGNWEKDTIAVNKITLLDNGTKAERKTPQVLQAISYLSENAEEVIIQTPYVICSSYMYEILREISDHAQLKIILNAVEKGSNPWGCTDYLNQKKKILKTGAVVYELMNDVPAHTKAVLIDDRLSVVGSYNLDMRSTYLDTELMLVIDSVELNSQIRDTENLYMEKSKEVSQEGQEKEGSLYEKKELTWQKKIFYGGLRILIRPLRQLL